MRTWFAQHHLAFDDDVDVDDDLFPDLRGAAQIEAGRVDQGGPAIISRSACICW